MVVLTCTFRLGRSQYQESQGQSENETQHNPCLLNSWIIVAGLAGLHCQLQGKPLIEQRLPEVSRITPRKRPSVRKNELGLVSQATKALLRRQSKSRTWGGRPQGLKAPTHL